MVNEDAAEAASDHSTFTIQNSQFIDSGIPWIPEIPKTWRLLRARYLFKQIERPVLPQHEVVTAYRDGQVTLRSKRRIEGYTFAILEQGYQGVCRGDLVVHGMDAFAGAIGVCEEDGKCTPEYAVLTPIIEGIDSEYFALLFRVMATRGYIHVICPSVRERAPRFRFPKLQDQLLPIPPIESQRQVVDFVRRIKLETGAVVSGVRPQIQTLQTLRSTLIAHAVTGKIRVG